MGLDLLTWFFRLATSCLLCNKPFPAQGKRATSYRKGENGYFVSPSHRKKKWMSTGHRKESVTWNRCWFEPGSGSLALGSMFQSLPFISTMSLLQRSFFSLLPSQVTLFSYSFHFKSTVSWLKMHLFWSLRKCSAFLPMEGSERAPQPWRYIINTLPEPLIPCPSLKYHYRKDFNKITAHYTLKFDFKRCLGFAERH